MVNSNMLLCLYSRVLEDTSFVKGVSEKDVKQAIEHMHKVYQGSPNSLSKNFDSFTDFNEVAYRCAYLFKYAPFHTALTYKAMSHALTESPYELRGLLDSLSGPLKLCSLGGGPGADVIGVLAAMHNQFGFFRSSVKLVDIMSEWELTFWSVLDELKQQNYGPLSESMSEKWLDWSFMTADLQSKMSRELTEVLGTADVVTMIKFVSAAACKETSSMIEKIFRIMKPGAFVLFVDNAAGGFKELISSAAKKYEFNAVSTPLKHQTYINEYFKNVKYGYKSCYESKVAVQLLMKSGPTNYSNECNLIKNWSCNENFPPSPVSHWQKIYVPRFQNFRIGPRPVGNLMNEHETFESRSPSNWHGSNFSPSSEFSPMLNRLNAQFDSPGNLYNSFESQPYWSSTPRALANQNGPVRDENQIYNAEYEDESFGHDLSLNAHYSNEINSPHLDNFASSPPSFWQKMCVPKVQTLDVSWLNIPATHDSGYSDESFQSKLSCDSPVYNSSPHFRASQRLGRISFKGIDNSVYNQSPLNSESPLHQPFSSNRHSFGILQHSERYEPERSWTRQSKNGLFLLPSPHQCPRKYKTPKRPRKVLMHQYKPYERKRSRTK